MNSDEQPLSIEFKINLMAKAKGELLIARGKVIKNGRRIKVCQSDVYSVQKGEEIHCAVALVSVYATKLFRSNQLTNILCSESVEIVLDKNSIKVTSVF